MHVAGQNIWVGKGDELTHYDWDSGKVVREITLPERGGELVENGDELLMLGEQSVTHISLVSGDSNVEQFGGAGRNLAGLRAEGSPGGGLSGAGQRPAAQSAESRGAGAESEPRRRGSRCPPCSATPNTNSSWKPR